MQKFCLALDLIDEPESIKKYEYHHAKGNDWPEVTQHDIDAGILNIEILNIIIKTSSVKIQIVQIVCCSILY